MANKGFITKLKSTDILKIILDEWENKKHNILNRTDREGKSDILRFEATMHDLLLKCETDDDVSEGFIYFIIELIQTQSWIEIKFLLDFIGEANEDG